MPDTRDTQVRTVQIPGELYERVAILAAQSEFESVEAFVHFVLQEVVDTESKDFTAEEEEKVRERLENLGYL
jgi:hypothetical protein